MNPNITPSCNNGETRRAFLTQPMAAAAAVASTNILAATAADRKLSQSKTASSPWYRRAYRWGQTNIMENDPTRSDIACWRQHCKRTQVQGLIINAGGI